jgi:hypothetical protein
VYFISNACFVKYEADLTLKGGRLGTNFLQCRPDCIPYIIVFSILNSTVRGCNFLPRISLYYSYQRKELPMFFILAVVVVLLLLALAGADLFVAQYNSDELSNMGVQEQ